MNGQELRLGISTLANNINKVEDPTAAIRVVAEHHERLQEFAATKDRDTSAQDKTSEGINADWAGIVDDIKAQVEGPSPWGEER